jgi:hypothetical protein
MGSSEATLDAVFFVWQEFRNRIDFGRAAVRLAAGEQFGDGLELFEGARQALDDFFGDDLGGREA